VRDLLGGGHASAAFIPHVFQSRKTYHLAIVATAEVLVSLVVDGLAQEMDRPIHKSEVCPTGMERFEALGHVVIAVISVRRGGAAIREQVIATVVDLADGVRPVANRPVIRIARGPLGRQGLTQQP